MTILDPEPKALLGTIMELALIETGDRASREHWQQTQLQNLIKYAVARSPFWRNRIGGDTLSEIDLASLPILTRQDLLKQVTSEGPLLRATDGLVTQAHATSGSSGVPVRFFFSEFNSSYNSIRSLTQYFMEGRDLSLNRTRVRPAEAPIENGISVKTSPDWIGSLGSLIKTGTNKHIEYFVLERDDCRKLVDELNKNDIGYLVCGPWVINTILSSFDPEFLNQRKTAMWIPLGGNVDPHLIMAFADLSIPIRANYSSEEVGMIGFECNKLRGHYHVATSNVVVEVVDQSHEIDGVQLGRVLVTHLHSYATPFIRYDLADLACLREKCPCGHNGPTIYNLQGRVSSVIKHRDGRLSPFYIRGQDLAARVALTEFRIRQTTFDKIVVDIGGRSELKAEDVAAIAAFIKDRAGQEFEIEVRACEQIDWGQSRKRPGFRCEI